MLAAIGNKLIKVGTKLGLYPYCCCGGDEIGCCPFTYNNVPYTIEFNCNGNIVTCQGTLINGNYIELDGPNRHQLQIVCTTSLDPCTGSTSFGGYFIIAYRDIGCYAVSFFDLGYDPIQFISEFCPNATDGSGQTFSFNNCQNFPPGVNVVVTVTT